MSEIKPWEIWIGWYHLGQGYDPPTEPRMVAVIEATTFKIACCIFEHSSIVEDLRRRMEKGDTYIEDIHFGHWYYKPENNSNSWTGKYYETKEEALKSFKL